MQVARSALRESFSAYRDHAPGVHDARNELEPTTAFRITTNRARLRLPRPAPVGDRDSDSSVLRPTGTVTVSHGAPHRLCRTLLPKSSLTSRTAISPHGCPGRAPRPRTRGRPAPALPAPQASRSPGPPFQSSAHRLPGRPRPGKSRGPPGGHTGMHARLNGARQAGTRRSGARPWPSVESRRLHRPSAGPGRRPLCVRGPRNMTVHSATR